MQKAKAAQADSAVDEQLTAALIEKLDADIPPVMFDAETENLVRDYDTRLRMQGLDLATYLKYTGMTLDSIREQMKPQAERQVKLRLALEDRKAENIEVSDEEIDAEYNRIAESYKVDVEKCKEPDRIEDLAKDLKVQKAIDLVKENAVITDKAARQRSPQRKLQQRRVQKRLKAMKLPRTARQRKLLRRKRLQRRPNPQMMLPPQRRLPQRNQQKSRRQG